MYLLLNSAGHSSAPSHSWLEWQLIFFARRLSVLYVEDSANGITRFFGDWTSDVFVFSITAVAECTYAESCLECVADVGEGAAHLAQQQRSKNQTHR